MGNVLLKMMIYAAVLPVILLGYPVDDHPAREELLSHLQVCVDHSRTVTIDTIDTCPFQPAGTEKLKFGYAPDLDLWIRIELTNSTGKTLHKILEYTNPLTTHLRLYDGQTHRLIQTEGSLSPAQNRIGAHPAFPLTLKPHESKIWYLKAAAKTTALITGLTLWNPHDYIQKAIRHQVWLALFFGAFGIIILYNLTVYLSMRELSYLYFVLAFIGIGFHHAVYTGINALFFPPTFMQWLTPHAAFLTGVPVFFLALFTREILKPSQYPKLDQILVGILIVFPILLALADWLEWNRVRSLFSIAVMLYLLGITLYALWRKNRAARYIALGWVVIFSSALFMYLASLGIFNLFTYLPYYTELTLIIEALIFSLLLTDTLKKTLHEKVTIQENFIQYQQEENMRLSQKVHERTRQLERSLEEQEILLRELNHRVKNSIQTILSFLRLQKSKSGDAEIVDALITVETRILSINHLYAILHTSGNFITIDAGEYFTAITDNLEEGWGYDHIDVSVQTHGLVLSAETAVYCGFIVNEAVTNAYKYAFGEQEAGCICIVLINVHGRYRLSISDNGVGFLAEKEINTLGLTIIETLATRQLEGTWKIRTEQKGITLEIDWKGEKK